MENLPFTIIWRITEDVIWIKDTLLREPTRYLDVKATVIFKKDMCCPVVLTDQIDSFRNRSYDSRCFLKSIIQRSEWFPTGIYLLDPKRVNPKHVNCLEDLGKYTCTIDIKYQWYEPKFIEITVGYFCEDYHKNTRLSLKNVIAELTINEASNRTRCEPIIKGTSSLQCENFYGYVSFPNMFGHESQSDANPTLDLLAALLNINSEICYQHQAYFLCQALFPECPPPKEALQGATTYLTDHLVVVCEEMCKEAFQACNAQQFQFIKSLDCGYYNSRKNSDTCVYKNVTCDVIPNVTNAEPLDVQNTYYAEDSINYVCDENYQIEGKSEVTCE